MPIRQDHRELLLGALERCVDAVAGGPGFVRSARSRTYKRSVGESTQILDMGYSSNPRYAPGAILHLYPYFRLAIPRVSRLTNEMTGGAVPFKDPAANLFSQPFQWYSDQGSGTEWLVRSSSDLEAALSQILSVFEQRILPLLDELTTPSGLIAVFEAGGDLPKFQQHEKMHLVAAYEVEGHEDQARAALEQHFGSIGLRRRFAEAFAWHA
jgi:hypothetical protein